MMTKPFMHALAATLYIAAVSSVMYYGPKFSGPKETVAVPIAILSLFTLSAAVMGYLFLAEPIQLYLDGKKKEAVSFFLRTVGIFGAVTTTLLALLFSGVFS